MHRRTFVERTTATLTVLGVAGCVGNTPSSDSTETETRGSGETPASAAATTAERDTETATTSVSEATETATATDVETTLGTATVDDDGPETATVPTKATTTLTPVRKTAGNVSAAFTITDYVRITRSNETVSASFDPDRNRIVVEGTTRIDGCGRLTLRSIRNEDETIVLVVGSDEYGTPTETRTVVCEPAMSEYEITITVDSGLPETIEVVHRQGDDETFTITR